MKHTKASKESILPSLAFLIVIMGVVLLYGAPLFTTLTQHSTAADTYFTIIMLPDTQKYAKDTPGIFDAQTQWIAENQKRLNIVFVAHVGDIVDTPDSAFEWMNAAHAMQTLTKNNIPYGVVLGNHDYTNIALRTTLFENYFSEKDFGKVAARTTIAPGESIATLQLKDKNLVVLFLPVCPTSAMLAWAKEELATTTSTTLFFTHGYLGADAERYVHVCESTQYIWDDFVKKQPHLTLVGSGHVHAEAIRFSKNDFNEQVLEFVSDYQEYNNQQSGYLKILTFYPDKDLLVMSTYSPTQKKFLDSAIDANFVFPLE